MRIRLALCALPLFVASAAAERTGGGGGGGGGALSKVSTGISTATHSPSPGSAGGSSTQYGGEIEDHELVGATCYWERSIEIECPYRVTDDGRLIRRRHIVRTEPAKHAADFDFYAGAQKVHDSDGSGRIELAVTDERFRVAGSFTRFFERLQGGGALTMSMPTLMGGVRIDDMGSTKVFLEGGVVHVRTNGDAMADSKITGPIAGLTVEHKLGKKFSLLGSVHQMWFKDDVKATDGHVGVRYEFLQAGFRVLDFNVGPPLYGPEVGVAF